MTDVADIEIEIDGQKLYAMASQTVIQVADEAGIYIPRFCYHKQLTIPANCRMCLVEVEKAPKTLPACATPVAPGMKVFTKSQKTIAAQRAVMEFLLINHPLDCPICDQGGECELQDLSLGYGASRSQYAESKRALADQDLGPLIATEMTRCIYCTRCVRFGDEVAGLREMGALGRGEFTEIGTYIKHYITSEVSGNIIDLCPVGALTSKPYRFTARPWEINQTLGISPHDCIGSNLNIHTRYGKVMRIVSHENPNINITWISDRDRFSYTGLSHADRLDAPRIRMAGEWQVVDWQAALSFAASGLKEMIASHGADQLGALASPSSTLEEFYLFQKIMRGLNCSHIDYRLREIDTRDQATIGIFPGFDSNQSFTSLGACDAILLIGTNIQKEQPIAGLNVRNASRNGASILSVNAVDYDFNFDITAKYIVAPHLLVAALAEIESALLGKTASKSATAIGKHLQGKQKICLVLGALALQHPEAAIIRSLTKKIAEQCGATHCIFTEGANAAGAWLTGAIPHRYADGKIIHSPGLSAYEMLKDPRKAYLLLNIEPDFDCANAFNATESLRSAQFVVALSTYRNAVLDAHANVVLPMAAFTETAGTFVNVVGEWQSFNGAAEAFASARPGWKILRVLGNFLQLEGFEYETAQAIKHEVKALTEKGFYKSTTFAEPEAGHAVAVPAAAPANSAAPADSATPTASENKRATRLSRIGEVPIYAIDSIVRRAQPLQQAQINMLGRVDCARIHPLTAKRLKLQAGTKVRIRQQAGEATLFLVLDNKIAENAVWVAGGITETSNLGDLFGDIQIETMTS